MVQAGVRRINVSLDTLDPGKYETITRRGRLNQVVDQLGQAPKQKNYLPYATSKELQKILEKLRKIPADDRSVAEWAEYINTTGRTLQRRCLGELGLTLVEWRQRLRFLRAVEALTAGASIQQAAFELGYSTPSAFVAMFHPMSGKPPGQYRSSHKIEASNRSASTQNNETLARVRARDQRADNCT
ncbi:helix-turn-helix domain-containing protein [Cohaesibacter haloalkalitolerans]|uniref:helix-turn-helix domain-containing protein n=1 Tax=Cohaesibacter haloalkalitolerans TaxID=1162980 RepID=UPI000E646C0E|nr:helix-turn-helix domain-containing protein [Cohaesibacter haloalkalitolerans]